MMKHMNGNLTDFVMNSLLIIELNQIIFIQKVEYQVNQALICYIY